MPTEITPKSKLNLSIATPVKFAAVRAFAGRGRGKQMSDEVQAFLAKRAVKLGQYVAPQFLSKQKSDKQ